MLNQLTKYLLQYRTVSIPHVGTIQITQHPPQLNVVDKELLPPSFSAELKSDETISEHQLSYLSSTLKEEKETVLHSLTETGLWLKERMQDEGFAWKGIGLIKTPGEAVTLPRLLAPVPAERVQREEAEHQVLVGNHHMTSTQIAELKAEAETGEKTVQRKRSLLIMTGWILLILSLLYIVFALYKGKFRLYTTGSKQAPTGLLLQQKRTVPTSPPSVYLQPL